MSSISLAAAQRSVVLGSSVQWCRGCDRRQITRVARTQRSSFAVSLCTAFGIPREANSSNCRDWAGTRFEAPLLGSQTSRFSVFQFPDFPHSNKNHFVDASTRARSGESDPVSRSRRAETFSSLGQTILYLRPLECSVEPRASSPSLPDSPATQQRSRPLYSEQGSSEP